jgi:hypothetical protein
MEYSKRGYFFRREKKLPIVLDGPAAKASYDKYVIHLFPIMECACGAHLDHAVQSILA